MAEYIMDYRNKQSSQQTFQQQTKGIQASSVKEVVDSCQKNERDMKYCNITRSVYFKSKVFAFHQNP